MAKVLGQPALERLSKAHDAAVESHHNAIARVAADLSYQPANPAVTGPPGYSKIGVVWVKPSMDAQYREVMKEFVGILRKADHRIGFVTYQALFGDSSYVIAWSTATPAQYYTENNVPALMTKALGEEGASQLRKRWLATVHKYTSLDSTPRMDLSYAPQPQ